MRGCPPAQSAKVLDIQENHLITTLLAAALVIVGQPAADTRLLRQPSIHGETVVFVYGGDIWKSTTSGGEAIRLTTYPNQESSPKISPDGTLVAFIGTYDGQPAVYSMPIEGGEPKRLTYTTNLATLVGWTPDGKVAFTSTDRTVDTPGLFFVGAKGGVPTRTKLYEMTSGSFSPDGQTVVFNRNASYDFNWRRYRGGTQGRISFFNLKTFDYEELPSGREQSYHPMWVGDTVYYTSDKNLDTLNLYSYNTKSKKTTQLTKFGDTDVRFPSTDGKSIVFERDGVLYVMSLADSSIKKITPKLTTDGAHFRPYLRKLGQNISDFSISPSGKRIVVEARGEIFSVPARSGETRALHSTPGVRERMPQWSPDGQSIAYMSDATGEAELYMMPQMGGKPTQLTTGGKYKILSYTWSPDGKKISFSTIDYRLHILDVETKKVVTVYQDPYSPAASYDWSADGSWIAYVKAMPNLMGAIHLYNVRTGKTYQVTEGQYGDNSVAFDRNGKYLYFTSNRTFNPTPGSFEYSLNFTNATRVYAVPLTKDLANPLKGTSDEEPVKEKKDDAKASTSFSTFFDGDEEGQYPAPAAAPAVAKDEKKEPENKDLKIDLDGFSDRIFALPWPGGNYGLLIGMNNGVAVSSNGSLLSFDFNSKQPQVLLEGLSGISVNADRSKMAYALGPQIHIVPMAPGAQPGQGRVNTDAVEATIDPRAEWYQIFNECWRYMRDNFYDPNFGGVDWNAMKARYQAYLPYITHRSDLNYVLGMMIGELGTGHAYVGGGDMGQTRPGFPTGRLGADFEDVNGKIKITKIYRGEAWDSGVRGPLTEPGLNVKAGDYLLEIDGRAVGGQVTPEELLINKVGRNVVLTVNSSPTLTGSRKITVRPIGSEGEIRYDDWVETNRKKVLAMSDGKIGYAHVPDTSEPGMIGFIRGYYASSDKQAFLIDERFNGGGMIPTYFFEKLLRTSTTALRPRNGADVAFPTQLFEGPSAMLINEYAGSGGDMFPWLFRAHKVGKLIGTRTWGGLVGIAGSAPVIDGGFFTAPSFGIYDTSNGQWIAENTGVDPDMKVDLSPRDRALGLDPQLEAGVKHLLEEIKKGNVKKSVGPKFGSTKPAKN